MQLNKNLDFSSFFIILIGDTHGYINDFKIQKEIIQKAKPKYVLCEQLEDKKLIKSRDFVKILNQKKISDMTELKEVEALIRLCKNKNIPVIGIDYKNFGIRWPQRFKEKLNSKENFIDKEKKQLDMIHKKREAKQLSMTKEYAKKGKIVVITGAYHLRKGSPLIKGLSGFLAVYPEYKGKMAFGPVADKRQLGYGVMKKCLTN